MPFRRTMNIAAVLVKQEFLSRKGTATEFLMLTLHFPTYYLPIVIALLIKYTCPLNDVIQHVFSAILPIIDGTSFFAPTPWLQERLPERMSACMFAK